MILRKIRMNQAQLQWLEKFKKKIQGKIDDACT